MPSHIASLSRLIDEEIRVELIAEPLHVVEGSDSAADVASHLKRLGYDECGVRRGGVVSASVRLADLVGETSEEAARPVPLERIVAPATPLWTCLERIARDGPLFLLGDHGLDGIVNRADLNKQPARLLMFGVLSMLEMVLLALIQHHYSGNEWMDKISNSRAEAAGKLYARRLKLREEIDLADCLQLCDKADVCRKTKAICNMWGLSGNQANRLFKALQSIRDNLAHSQSPAAGGDWSKTVGALMQGHDLLDQTLKTFLSESEDGDA